VVNRLFRLNLIKMYLATNINNPFSAPFLVYLEIQIGSLLRQGHFYEHTLENARTFLLRDFLFDVMLGSLTVGTLLGLLFAILTFIAVRQVNKTPAMALLVDQTGGRYLDVGLLHWEVARACLRFDPFYRKIVTSDVLPDSGSLIHVGCGRGLLLTFLDVNAQTERSKPEPPPKPLLSLRGIDNNLKKIEVARQVLGSRAQVECEYVGAYEFGRHDVVVNLDQFKSADRKDREAVLRRAAEAVKPGGILIMRASTAQPWTGLWPFTSLTESQVVKVLEGDRLGFTTRVLYRSLRRVVILANPPEPEHA